jgi:hypothetical protein
MKEQHLKHENFIYPFNERGDINKVKNSEEWNTHKKAFNGNLNQGEKNKLFERLQTNSFFKDAIPLFGVRFSYRPILKRYWVKTKYYGIQEVYSLNKTSIRNYFKDCLEIKEVY